MILPATFRSPPTDEFNVKLPTLISRFPFTLRSDVGDVTIMLEPLMVTFCGTPGVVIAVPDFHSSATPYETLYSKVDEFP